MKTLLRDTIAGTVIWYDNAFWRVIGRRDGMVVVCHLAGVRLYHLDPMIKVTVVNESQGGTP